MYNTICAIMHLFVTYQKEFCQLYPVSVYMYTWYIGVFQDRSTASSLCVGIPPLQYM